MASVFVQQEFWAQNRFGKQKSVAWKKLFDLIFFVLEIYWLKIFKVLKRTLQQNLWGQKYVGVGSHNFSYTYQVHLSFWVIIWFLSLSCYKTIFSTSVFLNSMLARVWVHKHFEQHDCTLSPSVGQLSYHNKRVPRSKRQKMYKYSQS